MEDGNGLDGTPNAGEMAKSVRVTCRFRPDNRLERGENTSAMEVGKDGQSVTLRALDSLSGDGGEPQYFTFDKVFGPQSTQLQVYESCARPLVAETLRGYNCTIFAYGQTGSGKTHTMMGPDGGELHDNPDLRGIVPRIAEDIFDSMADADSDTEFTIKVSFVEIYMERIQDLLTPNRRKQSLRIRQDKDHGIILEGATEEYVASPDELLDITRRGSACRAIASTMMNQDSSRSHSVFMITLSQRNTRTAVNKTGKLFLVDLAGSEMVKKTGAKDTVLEEAKMINRSLSALGNVIKALVEGSKHVPYRDSKLTRLLQDSLGGNSKTSLIITCSSSSYNQAETLSTLRFGTRAKRIKNKPRINQEYSITEYKAMLERANKTIQALKLQLDEHSPPIAQTDDEQERDFPGKGLVPGQKNHLEKQKITLSENEEKDDTMVTSSAFVPRISNQENDPSLLARAEHALTLALKNNETLTAKLEECENDLVICNNALEGSRKYVIELENNLSKSEQEVVALRAKVADLVMQNQSAEYQSKQFQVTIDGLQNEKNELINQLASFEKPARPPDSPASSTSLGHEFSNSSWSFQVGPKTTREELLEQDLCKLTEKYIVLRTQYMESQDFVKYIKDAPARELAQQLEHMSNHCNILTHKLKAANARLEVSRQQETTWMMKIENREAQIEFLEIALRDYQETYKTTMQTSSQQISKLQQELTRYKTVLENINACEKPPLVRRMSTTNLICVKTSPTEQSSRYKIMPRVVKPIRGGSANLVKKPPSNDDDPLQNKESEPSSSKRQSPASAPSFPSPSKWFSSMWRSSKKQSSNTPNFTNQIDEWNSSTTTVSDNEETSHEDDFDLELLGLPPKLEVEPSPPNHSPPPAPIQDPPSPS